MNDLHTGPFIPESFSPARAMSSCSEVRKNSLLALTRFFTFILVSVVLLSRAHGFALLGPYEDWMDVTNGFHQFGDIGGPMDLKTGYRWNVPVVSYGFDRSFLDYFGSNGVAAVEAAINLLNSLPPASTLVLTNYPLNAGYQNYRAAAQNLCDLKSATLCLLLEHLGLAQPVRSVFLLRRWDPILNSFVYLGTGPPWPDGVVPNLIMERNFDPLTRAPTNVVNGSLYAGVVTIRALGSNSIPALADVVEYRVDPLDASYQPVAENFLSSTGFDSYAPFGFAYIGLTYDDVGGLSYLLATNNVNFENLLPDVHPVDEIQSLVNGAWRHGVDKVTFVPHPVDVQSSAFTPMTNEFTDSYITHGQVLHQQLKRVMKQPDFIFSAEDLGKQDSAAPYYVRTGTTNWINNGNLNGTNTTAGPGVIAPPVNITFHKLGGWVNSSEPAPERSAIVSDAHWGSFDQSTNSPIVYPDLNSLTNPPLVLRLRLLSGGSSSKFIQAFDWQVPVPIGGTAQLLSSTNFMDWASVSTVTNNGGVIEWLHQGTSQSKRFFRVIPQ
jgi:hypothetical protein